MEGVEKAMNGVSANLGQELFNTSNITGANLFYYPAYHYSYCPPRPARVEGEINFKTSDTEGTKKFVGPTFPDVLMQMEAFCKTINR